MLIKWWCVLSLTKWLFSQAEEKVTCESYWILLIHINIESQHFNITFFKIELPFNKVVQIEVSGSSSRITDLLGLSILKKKLMLIAPHVLGSVETNLPTSGSRQLLEKHLVLKWRSLLLILAENRIHLFPKLLQQFQELVKSRKLHNFCYLILASLVVPGQQIWFCF